MDNHLTDTVLSIARDQHRPCTHRSALISQEGGQKKPPPMRQRPPPYGAGLSLAATTSQFMSSVNAIHVT